MKKILIILFLISPTLLLSQTHLVIPGKTSTTVSFGRDQNIDFLVKESLLEVVMEMKLMLGMYTKV